MAKQEESIETPVESIETPIESTYTRRELMAASYSAFGVAPEVVAGAMHLAGKTEMTKAEAEQAIKAFSEREV